MTSGLGGASEIAGWEKMVYEYGNAQGCIAPIRMIFGGEITYEEYWKNSLSPTTVEENCNELVNY
jgi:hypothetical protein